MQYSYTLHSQKIVVSIGTKVHGVCSAHGLSMIPTWTNEKSQDEVSLSPTWERIESEVLSCAFRRYLSAGYD